MRSLDSHYLDLLPQRGFLLVRVTMRLHPSGASISGMPQRPLAATAPPSCRQDLRQDRSHASRLSPHACSVMRLRGSRLSHRPPIRTAPSGLRQGSASGRWRGWTSWSLPRSPTATCLRRAAYQVTRRSCCRSLHRYQRRRRRLICCAGMGCRATTTLWKAGGVSSQGEGTKSV